eukprot:gene656-3964_t
MLVVEICNISNLLIDSSSAEDVEINSSQNRNTEEPSPKEESRLQKFRRSLRSRNASSLELNQQASVSDRFKGFRSNLDAMIEKLLRDSAKGIDFLAKLRNREAQEIAAQLKKFITKFEAEGETMDVQNQSKAVKDFFKVLIDLFNTNAQSNFWSSHTCQNLEQKLMTAEIFKNLNDNDISTILVGAERYITHHIYDMVFSHDPDNVARDCILQTKMYQLQRIRPHHLDACIDLQCPEVTKEFELAQDALITMDAKRSPLDKMECIMTGVKHIYECIRNSTSTELWQAAGADDFLPCFVYTLIQANPPRLRSNISYIEMFGNLSGELDYYFTQLPIAVSFMESICAQQLNMTQDQFERLIDGDACNVTEGLTSIRLMKECLDRLRRLENKQRDLQREIDWLLETRSELCTSAVKPLGLAPKADYAPYTEKLLGLQTEEGDTARQVMDIQNP